MRMRVETGSPPTPQDPAIAITARGSTQAVFTSTVQGVFWTYLSFATSKLLVFAATVILARLLAPAQFGQVAFALLVITYLETVGNLGFSAALIYEQDRADQAADIAFLISLLMGSLWCGLAIASAPWVSAFIHDPAVTPVLRAMAAVFVIKAAASTHEALLRRELAFKRRLIPDVAEALVKGFSSISLALLGLGVWSLVWGQLLGAAAFTLSLWMLIPWRPRWHWASEVARRMLRYGSQIVSVNVIVALLHHVDYLVVGRLLGSAALGFYSLAYRIPEMVIIMMIWVMGHVTFPAYARLQQDLKALQRAFLGSLRYLSLVTVPAGLGLALLGMPIIVTFYGNAWRPSIPVLQALALAAMLRSLSSHAGNIFKAIGRPNILTKVELASAVVLVPALIIGARWGIAGVAIAQALVMGASSLVSLLIAGRVLSIPASAMLAQLKPALVGTVAMSVGVQLLRPLLSVWAHGLTLLVSVAAGAAIYALTTWRVSPETMRGVRASLASCFGRAPLQTY